MSRRIILVAVAAAVVFVAISIFGLWRGDWYAWWPHLALEDIVDRVRDTGAVGVAAAIGLMVIHSFVPFPAELVAIANGMVYGTFWGTLITWCGAMLGAMLSFGLSRWLGRPFVEHMLKHDAVRRLDAWLDHHGPGSLMFSRFIPVIAFNLINYAAGLTRMSWWTFTWITGIGILPLTTLMVVMGDHAESAPWFAWLGLLCVGGVMWLVTHRWTRRLPGPTAPRGHQEID